MGKRPLAIIHANPAMPHQMQFAAAWSSGIRRRGGRAMIAETPEADGDLHIVIGPHFAQARWQSHPYTVLADRCFYGHHRQHISVGWLRPDGGRVWAREWSADRWNLHGPALGESRVPNGTSILLGDYNTDRETARRAFDAMRGHRTRYRPHPQDGRTHALQAAPAGDLEAILAGFDTAYGWHGTALVTAAYMGLTVVPLDPRSIVARLREDREAWCYITAAHNWHRREVECGAVWEVLDATANDHRAERRAGDASASERAASPSR